MSRPKSYTRRSFIGTAAAAAAAVPAAGALAGCQPNPASGGHQARPARHIVPENSLPGDKHWPIRHLGAPDAIMGYAGHASVLPGESVDLYVSTTAREFTVKAFRM